MLRRRRMVRSFLPDPLDPGLVARLLDDSLRGPTAGHTRGVAWLVLEGAQTADYWESVTTAAWRDRAARWPGLARAPVVALSLASPRAYAERYGEPDKAASGLGLAGAARPDDPDAAGAWPVPYWWGDAAFAVITLLLGAVDQGLGACFLGNFRGEEELARRLEVPPAWRLFGAVCLGRPDGADHRSPSLDRPGPSRAERIHHGRWGAGASQVGPGRPPA